MKKLLAAAFLLSGIAVTANAQTESKLQTSGTEKKVVHKATSVKRANSRNFTKKADAEVVNGKRSQRPVATPAPSVAKKKTLTKEMLKKKGFTKENLKPE